MPTWLGVRGGLGRGHASHTAGGELEVSTKATALLEGLGEHLVLADVVVGHTAAGISHGLLETMHSRQSRKAKNDANKKID